MDDEIIMDDTTTITKKYLETYIHDKIEGEISHIEFYADHVKIYSSNDTKSMRLYIQKNIKDNILEVFRSLFDNYMEYSVFKVLYLVPYNTIIDILHEDDIEFIVELEGDIVIYTEDLSRSYSIRISDDKFINYLIDNRKDDEINIIMNGLKPSKVANDFKNKIISKLPDDMRVIIEI